MQASQLTSALHTWPPAYQAASGAEANRAHLSTGETITVLIVIFI